MIREDVEEIKKDAENMKKDMKQEAELATMVINKLIKIIKYLIIGFLIFIAVNNGLWFWYISLPAEEVETSYYSQDADTNGENSSINQEIGE